jgi:esterase/lipase/1-acyl-sn-glycerol-3-phosphate acyltransferase
VHGADKIPNKPVLFVANHFTRSETFFLPYIINNKTNRHVRCLADSNLFTGFLGNFLQSIGVISTKDQNRDKIIISDLVKGEFDWMIYPEGRMIKNKRIIKKDFFTSVDFNNKIRVKTGSSVLAIKSEIYRQQIINAYINKNNNILDHFKKDFNIEYDDKFLDLKTHIIPLSITYYPLRPGKNIIKSILTKFFKDIPAKILEELEIEGNLLLNSEIDIYFGDPISIPDYIKNMAKAIDQIPIIDNLFKADLTIKYYRIRLANDFMSNIYNNIEINFDHIFAGILSALNKKNIEVKIVKELIYFCSHYLEKYNKYRINESAKSCNVIKIFYDEDCKIFDDIYQLAISQKIIKEISSGYINIDFDATIIKNNFNSVRIENSLKVIYNEFNIIYGVTNLINKLVKKYIKNSGDKFAKKLINNDLENYKNDYNKYYDVKYSKDFDIGKPFFKDAKSDIGVLLIHGYKSSPKEVEKLSNELQLNFNFKIYAVRLKGHGTAPHNIKDINWQDWYESVNIGYAILGAITKKIIIIGFSTGGLLSLLMASNKDKNYNKISEIISINSALKLRDIRSHLVKGVSLWNDILDSFKIDKVKLEYIDNIPENPAINYSRNYLNGVIQLEKLMNKVNDNLKKINNNILIIQGDNDPVVNPKSAEIIYNKIDSAKTLKYVKSKKHVIILGEQQNETFAIINNFVRQNYPNYKI